MIYSNGVNHYRYKQSASPYRSIGELKWVPPLVLPILILRWCHGLNWILLIGCHVCKPLRKHQAIMLRFK